MSEEHFSADLADPTELYKMKFHLQPQKAPGVQAEMDQIPDCGETSYVGCGRLAGRKALVTGGDSGIGRAAAIAFAREGADVAINYLPSEQENAEDVRRLIEAEEQVAVLLPGDVSNEAFCKEMVENAVTALDGVDILCLAAGKQVANDDIETLPSEQLVKTFETNVFALFWIIKAALPHMPKGSAIITTSSVEAYQPEKHLIDYASSKSAIKTFTQALAKQLAPKGIRANAVAPGPVWTALQISGGQLPENIPAFGLQTPMGRAGQPAELAAVYVFLASEEASFVTGQIYGITGGMLLA